MIAPRSVFGEVDRDLANDLDHADLALVWGANPATASPPENLVRLKALQARGGRVVVIDHRRSRRLAPSARTGSGPPAPTARSRWACSRR